MNWYKFEPFTIVRMEPNLRHKNMRVVDVLRSEQIRTSFLAIEMMQTAHIFF